jgi:hypothetical protein
MARRLAVGSGEAEEGCKVEHVRTGAAETSRSSLEEGRDAGMGYAMEETTTSGGAG